MSDFFLPDKKSVEISDAAPGDLGSARAFRVEVEAAGGAVVEIRATRTGPRRRAIARATLTQEEAVALFFHLREELRRRGILTHKMLCRFNNQKREGRRS